MRVSSTKVKPWIAKILAEQHGALERFASDSLGEPVTLDAHTMIGCGLYGCVMDLFRKDGRHSGYVLKLTSDEGELLGWSWLQKLALPGVVKIAGVGKGRTPFLGPVEVMTVPVVVVREKVGSWSQADQLDGEARLRRALAAKLLRDYERELIREKFWTGEPIRRLAASAMESPATRDFGLAIQAMLEAGLLPNDIHEGNVGWREDGTLVLYDPSAEPLNAKRPKKPRRVRTVLKNTPPRPLPPRRPGMISPMEQLALKRGFVPLDPKLIGAGTGVMARAGGNLYVSPGERDQIMAWAREYEALAREIDRRYHSGRVEGVEDLEHRAGLLEHLLEEALEEASTSEEDLATSEDTRPLMDLEGQVADLYHQFLTERPGDYGRFTPDRFSAEHGITTREGVLADTLRHMLADAHRSHGGELTFVGERSDPYRATDQQLIAAAADAHRRRIELRARYKGPKRFPAKPKIPPTQKNPAWLGDEYVLALPGQTSLIGPERGHAVRDGVARYVSPHGSHRFVLYEAGVAIAGLQVMSRDGKHGTIAYVYTRPERRREHLAQRLLAAARERMVVEHSPHLTELGQRWKRGIGENPPWRRRPQTNPALLPEDPWSKRLRAVANRTVVKLYPDEAASATAGGCWIVGEALRRLHGGDLEVVIEESPRTGNEWCSPIVHHVVLRLPDGRLLDGDGLHADDDMLAKARGSWAIALGRFYLGALDADALIACQTAPPKPGAAKFKKLTAALKAVGSPPPVARNNGDAEQRRRERAAAATGDVAARANVLVDRLRAGLVTTHHLAVAGYLGDVAAAQAVPTWVPSEPMPARSYPVRHALGHAGLEQPLLVRLAVDFAERALPAFEARYPGDPRPRQAIEAARAWLVCPCEGHQTAAAAAAYAYAAYAAYAAAAAAYAAYAAAAYAAADADAAAYAHAVAAAYAYASAADADAAAAYAAEREWQRQHMIAVLCGDLPSIPPPVPPPPAAKKPTRTRRTKKNGDQDLRALEREAAASGTREDRVRLDVARYRHGQPSVLGMLARWLPFDVQFEGGRYVPTAGVLWQRAIGQQATEIEAIGRRLYGQNFWFEPPAGGRMAVGIRANQDYEQWLGHERHLAGEIERAGYRVEWSTTPWGEGERVTGFSVPLDVERARLAHDLHDEYVAMIAAARRPQQNPPRGTLRAALESMRPALAQAANRAIDDFAWDEGGGACDAVSAALGDVLAMAGIDTLEGGHDGDDHAWLVAYSDGTREAYGVDVPPDVYEVGGGYSWRRRQGAVVLPEHVAIWPIKHSDLQVEGRDS